MRLDDVGRSRKKFLVKHELIGLGARVVEAADPGHQGLEGRVVDETQHTLHIEVEGRELTIPKRGSIFAFQLGEEVLISGDRLLHRPEDRIKKAR